MDDNNNMMISRSDSSTVTPLLSGVSSAITKLPDSILQFIGGYLPNCSRAMMAAALSRPACFTSDILDFGEISSIHASKLTDDDIAGILLSIDAVNTLKVLKIIGCDNISGVGLVPLRGSSVLQQIDLSTTDEASGMATNADFFSPNFPWCFALSQDAVVPILDSIISKEDKSLKHVKFPLFWTNNRRFLLKEFMERYHAAQNSRTCRCTKCKEGFQAHDHFPWMNHNSHKSCNDWGLQNFTCYDCLSHSCYDCAAPFCKMCEKMFCGDCATTLYCNGCDMFACNKCDEFSKCDNCGEEFCSNCDEVNLCECCNQARCFNCASYYTCEGDCGSNNCDECAHADNVQWCESCETAYCNECRLEDYEDGDLDCQGCRGFLLPQIMQEKDSLREQLDAIKNGTSIHIPETKIEFVMERAHCSRDDAIKALKEAAGSYTHVHTHLDDAVALLTLKPKSNDSIFDQMEKEGDKNNI